MSWSITATTVYCDAVGDEVTLLVYRDGSAKCTGFRKYRQPRSPMAEPAKGKSRPTAGVPACDGEQCARVFQYRDKLFAEEAGGK
ncbi:MAG: hypothetical protein C4555_07405 [Dehalococcoidia bacterium]|nr:MAG: hypothetical protein C4555_07405 [Dehalococcoidia bacterium]